MRWYLTFLPEFWSDRIEIIGPIVAGSGIGWVALCASLPLSLKNLWDTYWALNCFFVYMVVLLVVWAWVPSRVSVIERYGTRRPIVEALAGTILALFLLFLSAAALLGEFVLAARMRALQPAAECVKDLAWVDQFNLLLTMTGGTKNMPSFAGIKGDILSLAALAEKYGEADDAARLKTIEGIPEFEMLSRVTGNVRENIRILVRAHGVSDKVGNSEELPGLQASTFYILFISEELRCENSRFVGLLLLMASYIGGLMIVFRQELAIPVGSIVIAGLLAIAVFLLLLPPLGTIAVVAMLVVLFRFRCSRRVVYLLLLEIIDAQFLVSCFYSVILLLGFGYGGPDHLPVPQFIAGFLILISAPMAREWLILGGAKPSK